MDSLEMIHTFREVVARGGFSKAANSLGMSKANVSKYVSNLEERLGVRLLHRSTRSISLTDAGSLLLERSEPLMDLVNNTRNELVARAAEPSGRVRMSVVSTLSEGEFSELLIEFAQKYPKVHLSVEYTNRRVDLVEEAVDVVIRAGRIRDSDLIVRKLRPIHMAVVATPGYWHLHGKPEHPKDLARHHAVVFNLENSSRSGQTQWEFVWDGSRHSVPVSGLLDSNDGRALRGFVLGGLGVGYVPRVVVDEYIAQGLLESVLDAYMPSDNWLVAAYTQRRHNSAALRTLLEFLEQRFKLA
jgi:DNA-binding transcriptional LysR family regulator